jgi:hypothetical protein
MKLTQPGPEGNSERRIRNLLDFSGVLDPPTGREHSDKFLEKAEGPEKLLQAIADLLRYRRFQIYDRNYRAEIACDTLNSPTVWHYIIEQLGSTEIISWSQAPTEEAALAAAKEELNSLNKRL